MEKYIFGVYSFFVFYKVVVNGVGVGLDVGVVFLGIWCWECVCDGLGVFFNIVCVVVCGVWGKVGEFVWLSLKD